MRTEEELIYTIWDIVRGGQFNQDDPINERLMRAFLRIHRGKHLSNAYAQGLELPDEVFQYLGAVHFEYINNEFVSNVIPKIIQFKEQTGIMVDIGGYPVSVVGSEEYRTSKKHRFNRHHPLIKFVNNRLVMSKGMKQANQLDNNTGSELNTVVGILEAAVATGYTSAKVQAVLVNPDDEPGYDFTRSPYPYPDELIEDLINSVNAREFNLFLRMKSDTTGDKENDASPEQHNKDI